MNPQNIFKVTRGAALIAATTLTLSGCSYDYVQHTDRVAYSAGDAVKANLEAQTANPSSGSRYSTDGLGANGVVLPGEPVAP